MNIVYRDLQVGLRSVARKLPCLWQAVQTTKSEARSRCRGSQQLIWLSRRAGQYVVLTVRILLEPRVLPNANDFARSVRWALAGATTHGRRMAIHPDNAPLRGDSAESRE